MTMKEQGAPAAFRRISRRKFLETAVVATASAISVFAGTERHPDITAPHTYTPRDGAYISGEDTPFMGDGVPTIATLNIPACMHLLHAIAKEFDRDTKLTDFLSRKPLHFLLHADIGSRAVAAHLPAQALGYPLIILPTSYIETYWAAQKQKMPEQIASVDSTLAHELIHATQGIFPDKVRVNAYIKLFVRALATGAAAHAGWSSSESAPGKLISTPIAAGIGNTIGNIVGDILSPHELEAYLHEDASIQLPQVQHLSGSYLSFRQA